MAGWWLFLHQLLSVSVCVLCIPSVKDPCPSLGTCPRLLHTLSDPVAEAGTVSLKPLLRRGLQVRLAPGAEGQAQSTEKIMSEGSGRKSRGNSSPLGGQRAKLLIHLGPERVCQLCLCPPTPPLHSLVC